MNFIIKTHSVETVYNKPCFFILNKGMNSGKPHEVPFVNCFVLIFQNEEHKEDIFWIALSLWKSKFWHKFLRGSVIPFITIYDFKKEFHPKVTKLMQEHELHKKNIKALKLLQEQENHYNKNLYLINELRNAILMRYNAT